MITFSYSLSVPLPPGGPGPTSNVPPTLTSGGTTPPLLFSELYLDPETGDLPIQPWIVQGADAIVQRIRTRFKFFKGEWFLDQRLGVPWLQQILIKNPSPLTINYIFTQVLLTTPGIVSVQSLTATWDKPSRTLTASFQATCVDGTVIIATAEPFIIGPRQ